MALLNTYDDSDTIILIGHSFGADSLLKVAERTDRQIDLLVSLDAVGAGDLRSLIPVRKNVRYLYNRWQGISNPPIDFGTPGGLESHAFGSLVEDFGIQDQGKVVIGHSKVPALPEIQNDLIRIIASFPRLDARTGVLRLTGTNGNDAFSIKRLLGGAIDR